MLARVCSIAVLAGCRTIESVAPDAVPADTASADALASNNASCIPTGTGDTTPPVIASTRPGAGAVSAIWYVGRVEVWFSEPVQGVNEASFRLVANGSPLPTNVFVTDGGTSAFVRAVDGWPIGAYSVSLTSHVCDLAGNPLAPHEFTFTAPCDSESCW